MMINWKTLCHFILLTIKIKNLLEGKKNKGWITCMSHQVANEFQIDLLIGKSATFALQVGIFIHFCSLDWFFPNLYHVWYTCFLMKQYLYFNKIYTQTTWNSRDSIPKWVLWNLGKYLIVKRKVYFIKSTCIAHDLNLEEKQSKEQKWTKMLTWRRKGVTFFQSRGHFKIRWQLRGICNSAKN